MDNTSRPLHFDVGKHLPITPYSLPIAIWDLVEQAWPGGEITFTENHPKYDVSGPTVVWSIYRRVPGRDGVEVLKPRIRRSYIDENDSTISYEHWSQWMTIIYQFDIYHISNYDVNILTEKFDEFLYHITPTLRELGVSEWLFDEQTAESNILNKDVQDIYKRTLRFRCILERKFIKSVPTIQSIWLKQGVSSSHRIDNEVVVRDGMTARDKLSTNWISSVFSIASAPLNLEGSIPESEYVENVDFKIYHSIPSGESFIEWLPDGKHPMPGDVYYTTYYHYYVDPKVPVTKNS